MVKLPSRITKRKPVLRGTGSIRVITTSIESPGVATATPSGKSIVPVTLRVLKNSCGVYPETKTLLLPPSFFVKI